MSYQGGDRAEFGIIDDFDPQKDYGDSYDLERYDWLVKQMKRRIGEPPNGVRYPIWAWHSLDNRPAKVDLRRSEFNNYSGEHYILTIDVPEEQVLLSDEENWHFILNSWFLSSAKNENDFVARHATFPLQYCAILRS